MSLSHQSVTSWINEYLCIVVSHAALFKCVLIYKPIYIEIKKENIFEKIYCSFINKILKELNEAYESNSVFSSLLKWNVLISVVKRNMKIQTIATSL